MKTIPSEPIGSIPRPKKLVEAMSKGFGAHELEPFFDEAVKETIREFEATGSEVITDGEQRKPSFLTYPIHGLSTLSADGVVIPFADGHTRQLPKINAGPFRYQAFAEEYFSKAKGYSHKKLKQAVISASALGLLYPPEGIKGYSREEFLSDLVNEAEKDIRKCLDAGAIVQIDFTEGRLSLKLDPSKGLLKQFIDLNNKVLARFSAEERLRIGVHTCPGGDHDSTHSADVDYTSFLPELFQLNAGNFYVQLSSEKDRIRSLQTIKPFAKGTTRIFVGVTDPISARIESTEDVLKQIQTALDYLPLSNFGTTDDCGFAPFCDDFSTSRETAFAKIKARIGGTRAFERKYL
jgi:5-methyltetrahydropteroyltriglutamate--homocysteine methyltransferase